MINIVKPGGPGVFEYRELTPRDTFVLESEAKDEEPEVYMVIPGEMKNDLLSSERIALVNSGNGSNICVSLKTGELDIMKKDTKVLVVDLYCELDYAYKCPF